jgi:hypothetical protein
MHFSTIIAALHVQKKIAPKTKPLHTNGSGLHEYAEEKLTAGSIIRLSGLSHVAFPLQNNDRRSTKSSS